MSGTPPGRGADTARGKVFAPAAEPGSSIVGAFLGLALLGLVVAAVRDLLVRAGWLHGTEWLRGATDWVADLRWWQWMWPAAIGLIVLGLLLIVAAVKPRRHTHLQFAARPTLWTRRGDLARRCSAAVSAIPGVDHAITVVGRRRVTVTVSAAPDVDDTTIEHTVAEVIGVVAPHRKVRIRRTARLRGPRLSEPGAAPDLVGGEPR